MKLGIFNTIIISILALFSCTAQNEIIKPINDNMKQALIIIDVQEGFFSDPNSPVYNEKLLIENINRLIDYYRERGEPIIFVRHTEMKGEELERESKAWQVYSKLKTTSDDYYVDKTTPDSFLNTDLLKILSEENISSIVIVGLQTEYCIDTTCKSAFGKNIKAILVSDAHSTYDNSFMKANKIVEYHNKLIGRWFAELKTTAEIINNSPK